VDLALAATSRALLVLGGLWVYGACCGSGGHQFDALSQDDDDGGGGRSATTGRAAHGDGSRAGSLDELIGAGRASAWSDSPGGRVSLKSQSPLRSPLRQPLLDAGPEEEASGHSPTPVATAAAAEAQAAGEDADLAASDEREARAQRLAEGVARLQTLAWACCVAQVGLVVGKLLARLCSLAGDAGDGWFWAAACGAGVVGPTAEAWLATATLGEAAARHARLRGWTTEAGDAEKRAEVRFNTLGIVHHSRMANLKTLFIIGHLSSVQG